MCITSVLKVPFRVFDKMKNEFQKYMVEFCFYLNMKNEFQIIGYYFHVKIVLRMIVIIRTCHNWYYNSNSLAIQRIGLKRNIFLKSSANNWLWNLKFFPKWRRHFMSFILDILTKIDQTLKNIFWGSVRHTEDPGNLRRTLSQRNLKRNLNRTL